MIRQYFNNQDAAWEYALELSAKRIEVLDYGKDHKGYYIEYRAKEVV